MKTFRFGNWQPHDHPIRQGYRPPGLLWSMCGTWGILSVSVCFVCGAKQEKHGKTYVWFSSRMMYFCCGIVFSKQNQLNIRSHWMQSTRKNILRFLQVFFVFRSWKHFDLPQFCFDATERPCCLCVFFHHESWLPAAELLAQKNMQSLLVDLDFRCLDTQSYGWKTW